jgi:hypothetical protein
VDNLEKPQPKNKSGKSDKDEKGHYLQAVAVNIR